MNQPDFVPHACRCQQQTHQKDNQNRQRTAGSGFQPHMGAIYRQHQQHQPEKENRAACIQGIGEKKAGLSQGTAHKKHQIPGCQPAENALPHSPAAAGGEIPPTAKGQIKRQHQQQPQNTCHQYRPKLSAAAVLQPP